VVLGTFLIVLSSIFFVAAILFSCKLSRETKGEKYWFFFVVSALGFGLSHLAAKGFLFGFSFEHSFIVHELGEIIGAFSLAYATFGLYSSMKKIRERMSEELEE
jgi:hypothetical protein